VDAYVDHFDKMTYISAHSGDHPVFQDLGGPHPWWPVRSSKIARLRSAQGMARPGAYPQTAAAPGPPEGRTGGSGW